MNTNTIQTKPNKTKKPKTKINQLKQDFKNKKAKQKTSTKKVVRQYENFRNSPSMCQLLVN